MTDDKYKKYLQNKAKKLGLTLSEPFRCTCGQNYPKLSGVICRCEVARFRNGYNFFT